MSRKVLYRAWDKKYKVMLEGFAIYDEGDHIGMSTIDSGAYYTEEQTEMDMGGHFGSGDDWLFLMNDFELMQCTGIKDKKGEFIFEGDIQKDEVNDCIEVCRFNETTGSFGFDIYGLKELIGENGEECYGAKREVLDFLPMNEYSSFDIITNKHSNPELLQP